MQKIFAILTIKQVNLVFAMIISMTPTIQVLIEVTRLIQPIMREIFVIPIVKQVKIGRAHV